jgi:ATP-dependent 26S proteasome regulatory subunit
MHGPPRSGKTALAASIAMASGFPYVKFISPEAMVGFNEFAKVQYLSKVFNDSCKSPASLIVVDNIECIMGKTFKKYPSNGKIGLQWVPDFPMQYFKLCLFCSENVHPSLVVS